MADFLLRHGPLKVDDPLVKEEMTCFPKEALSVVEASGGIGEFLKDDMKFAYVGDTYICHVNDVASAYKMCSSSSLSTNFKALESLDDSTDISSYYTEYSNSSSHDDSGLNPNALEYTPVISPGASQNIQHTTKNLNPCSLEFLPRTFDASPSSAVKNASPFVNGVSSEAEVHMNKSKSYDEFSTGISQISDSEKHSFDNFEGRKKISNNCTFKSSNVDLKLANESSYENSSNSDLLDVCDGNTPDKFSKLKKLEAQLLPILKQYYGEDMESHRKNIDKFLKPYVIKKLSESGTITDSLKVNENNA